MEARYAQTEGTLRKFHQNFEKSRAEMIQRFLQDQDDLNRKFSEYDFNVTEVENNRSGNEGCGITAEDLQMNFRQSRGRELDEDSVRSLQTECSFTDSSEDEQEVINKPQKYSEPVSQPNNNRPTSSTKGKETVCQKLSLSTPRFEKPERKLESSTAKVYKSEHPARQESTSKTFGRSKSMRAPGSSSSPSKSKPKKIEQPPNSPEIVRQHESINSSKPPLNVIRTGKKPSEKADKPRKLLTRRLERPNTAMGLVSPGGMSLTPEVDYQPLDRMPDGSNGWDTESVTPAVRTGVSVRSAPLPMRQRVVSWESEQLKDNYNTFVSKRNSKVPPLPSNLSQGAESGNPSYAQTYDSSVDTHKLVSDNSSEKVRFRSVTPSYGHTYDNINDKQRTPQDKAKNLLRSKSISVKPFTKSHSDYFSSSKMADVNSNCVNLCEQEINDQSSNKNYSKSSNDSQGQLRRYKGHSNLNRSDQARGAQLAVLKLPPVSKKQPPDIPKRSGTSLSYFGKETSVMKMMPVHIGEEF